MTSVVGWPATAAWRISTSSSQLPAWNTGLQPPLLDMRVTMQRPRILTLTVLRRWLLLKTTRRGQCYHRDESREFLRDGSRWRLFGPKGWYRGFVCRLVQTKIAVLFIHLPSTLVLPQPLVTSQESNYRSRMEKFILPRSLTVRPWKGTGPQEERIVFQLPFFRGYVKLQGCRTSKTLFFQCTLVLFSQFNFFMKFAYQILVHHDDFHSLWYGNFIFCLVS